MIILSKIFVYLNSEGEGGFGALLNSTETSEEVEGILEGRGILVREEILSKLSNLSGGNIKRALLQGIAKGRQSTYNLSCGGKGGLGTLFRGEGEFVVTLIGEVENVLNLSDEVINVLFVLLAQLELSDESVNVNQNKQ